MKIEDLDRELQKVYETDIDDDFINFANDIIPMYPVYEDLGPAANEYGDRMEDALMIFSGSHEKELGSFGAAARTMKEQEVRSSKWNGMYPEVGAAAMVVAIRTDEGLRQSGIDQVNTQSIMNCIGLYTYAVIACNDCFKPGDFRKIFVAAWFIYFGKILSQPAPDIR
ncbi:MAG: hypothetical protein KBS36_04220 [Bacteroidales bacterium]|nr:hypothetical protein [Candidatus Cryptobacteroides fimicaballi]